MIIEEGFLISDLERIVRSMDVALGECGASLVTGDTKVMERGALDGIVINTAGIGIADTVVRDRGLVPGDLISSMGRSVITALPLWPNVQGSGSVNRSDQM